MATELLSEDIKKQVKDVFAELQNSVEVLFFGKKEGCDYCDDTRRLIEEVVGLSDKLSTSVYDLEADKAVADQYNVDKAPSIVIAAKDDGKVTDHGIRYAGIPSGHEFSSLINDMILVSKRDSALQQETRDFLKDLKSPVKMYIFVTPTCPYCPRSVMLAHQMAFESPMVEAEMVEAIEFPELSNRFNVSGVPQTTINDGAGTVVGAVPEQHLLTELKRIFSNN